MTMEFSCECLIFSDFRNKMELSFEIHITSPFQCLLFFPTNTFYPVVLLSCCTFFPAVLLSCCTFFPVILLFLNFFFVLDTFFFRFSLLRMLISLNTLIQPDNWKDNRRNYIKLGWTQRNLDKNKCAICLEDAMRHKMSPIWDIKTRKMDLPEGYCDSHAMKPHK